MKMKDVDACHYVFPCSETSMFTLEQSYSGLFPVFLEKESVNVSETLHIIHDWIRQHEFSV